MSLESSSCHILALLKILWFGGNNLSNSCVAVNESKKELTKKLKCI